MQALDVGVIPFRANDPYVQGINPNKVYQYLASGIPVVTTPVLDLEPNSPHLQFATDPAGMAAAVGRALDRPAPRDARQALARPHDWGVLAERMVNEIETGQRALVSPAPNFRHRIEWLRRRATPRAPRAPPGRPLTTGWAAAVLGLLVGYSSASRSGQDVRLAQRGHARRFVRIGEQSLYKITYPL
jgi:hypothetical protein